MRCVFSAWSACGPPSVETSPSPLSHSVCTDPHSARSADNPWRRYRNLRMSDVAPGHPTDVTRSVGAPGSPHGAHCWSAPGANPLMLSIEAEQDSTIVGPPHVSDPLHVSNSRSRTDDEPGSDLVPHCPGL